MKNIQDYIDDCLNFFVIISLGTILWFFIISVINAKSDIEMLKKNKLNMFPDDYCLSAYPAPNLYRYYPDGTGFTLDPEKVKVVYAVKCDYIETLENNESNPKVVAA